MPGPILKSGGKLRKRGGKVQLASCASRCCGTTSDTGYLEAQPCTPGTGLTRVFVPNPVTECYTFALQTNQCYTVYPGIGPVFTNADVLAVNGLIQIPPESARGLVCCECQIYNPNSQCFYNLGPPIYRPLYNCADPVPPYQEEPNCCVQIARRVDIVETYTYHQETLDRVSGNSTSTDTMVSGTSYAIWDATDTYTTLVNPPLTGTTHFVRTCCPPADITSPATRNPIYPSFHIGYPWWDGDCSSSYDNSTTGNISRGFRTLSGTFSCDGFTKRIQTRDEADNGTSYYLTTSSYSATMTITRLGNAPCGSGGCIGEGGTGPGGANGGVRIPPQPVPPSQWPLWVRAAAMLKSDSDKGLGDTVRRTIGEENSDAFKAFYKRVTGKDCGCANRQARWNTMYPY